MKVARLRLQRFRGFENMVIVPAGHAVLVGEPRAGRSDTIRALRRVLNPRSTAVEFPRKSGHG
jgi:putative ATP-dependent endonuclease of OLD family